MSIGRNKTKTVQRTQQQQSGASGPDAATQARVDEIYGAGQAAGNAMPSSVTNALGFLGGDPNAINTYMNPYQGQVIDAYLANLDKANALGTRSINDAATKARAFGGSRHGIATGTMLAENRRNTGNQIASLLAGGYDQATQRAMAAANLGMTAGSPELWKLQMLRQGFSGLPYGTTYSQQGSGVNKGTETGTNMQWKAPTSWFG